MLQGNRFSEEFFKLTIKYFLKFLYQKYHFKAFDQSNFCWFHLLDFGHHLGSCEWAYIIKYFFSKTTIYMDCGKLYPLAFKIVQGPYSPNRGALRPPKKKPSAGKNIADRDNYHQKVLQFPRTIKPKGSVMHYWVTIKNAGGSNVSSRGQGSATGNSNSINNFFFILPLRNIADLSGKLQ